MASGKIIGTVTGNYGSKHDFWIDWFSSFDGKNSEYTVTATAYLQLKSTSTLYAYNLGISSALKKITINGETATSNKNGIDTRNHALVEIATITKKINENTSGYTVADISASFPSVTSNLTGGTASGQVILELVDNDLPNFGETIQISNITQTSADVSFTPNDTLDKVEYSIDNKQSWVEVNNTNFTIDGLIPNTSYDLYIKIRRQSNQLEATSTPQNFKTLSVYIESLEVSSTFKVGIGKIKTLDVVVKPENASIKMLDVVSSNIDIIKATNKNITIDGNIVKIPIEGVANGYATLTISTTDGTYISTNVNVSVIRGVEGIQIYPNEIEIAKGNSFEVTYTVLPEEAEDKEVTIVSNDTSVVQINGKIATAIENGECEIIVTTVDGGYSATLMVKVVGEYTWYNYSTPLEILNTEDIEKISSNMQTIKNLLFAKGYTLDSELVDINELTGVYEKKATKFVNIWELLQTIELNLWRMNIGKKNDEYLISVYFVKPVTIGEYASNKEDIWRWLQILNDLYIILMGERGVWSYLLCTDGYPTINGKKILLRGDLIG